MDKLVKTGENFYLNFKYRYIKRKQKRTLLWLTYISSNTEFCAGDNIL